MGQMEAPRSWKNCEKWCSEETRCGAKEGDQKLQGHCADIGDDVEMVRVLYHFASGKHKRT